MTKTVICHFYNEEFLLPWWLKHHKEIFDHGIMIDYASTDRSCELIARICPTWDIVPSRNKFFDGIPVDEEVMDYELTLHGWRMALNVTEFLVGNIDRLHNRNGEKTQHLISNYVFVDMEDATKGSPILLHDIPLYQQRFWGYHDNMNTGQVRSHGSHPRMNRSIHNFPIRYTGGRHFPNTDYSFDDLAIFYYGWVDINQGLKRKLQIKDKIGEDVGTVHHWNEEKFINMYRQDQQPLCEDLSAKVAQLTSFQAMNELNKRPKTIYAL